jgi:hypothetical protein
MVGVNLKSMPASGLGPKDTFVFRNNSAGFGVPRGSLGKLNSFSGQTAQRGMTTTNVYYGGQANAAGGAARSGNIGPGASNVGTTLSARPTSPAGMQSNRSYSGGGGGGGGMQSASPGAGAAHSSMQSGAGGGGRR